MNTMTKMIFTGALKAMVFFVMIPALQASASTPPPINFEGRLVERQECQSGLAIIGQPYIQSSTEADVEFCVQMAESVRISPSLQKLASVLMKAFPHLTKEEATLQALKRQPFLSVTASFYGDSLILETVDSRLE
jgi:hypothetical protein